MKEKSPIHYQFTAILANPTINIWRRFTVKSNTSLSDLAYYLISIFGGHGSHMYSFYIDATRYISGIEMVDCGTLDDENDEELAEMCLVEDVIRPSAICIGFNYDYGDDWKITLIFEDYDSGSEDRFKLIEGAGFGMIEDCGGTYTLSEMLEMKENRPEEFNEIYSEWLQNVWKIDPEKIDFRGKIDVAAIEAKAKKNVPLFRKGYEGHRNTI